MADAAFWVGCLLVSIITYIGVWKAYEALKRWRGFE